MSTPIVYSSTDYNAPVFVPNDLTTWLPVLKACLVTGYNSTQVGAGWSVAFEDDVNNAIIFKQGGGNGRYVRFNNPVFNGYPSNTSLSANYFSVYGFEAVSSISSGTGQFPATSWSNLWTMAPGNTLSSSTPYAWRLIADNKFFIFITYPTTVYGSGSSYKTIFFFGDFPSNVSGDVYNTILNGYTSLGSSGYQYATGSGDSYPFTNDTSPNGSCLWAAGPFYQTASLPANVTLMYSDPRANAFGGTSWYPDPITHVNDLASVYVGEAWNGYTSLRGTLPGIFVPCFRNAYLADGTIIEGTGTQAGHTFMCVNNWLYQGNNTSAQLFIQTDAWPD